MNTKIYGQQAGLIYKLGSRLLKSGAVPTIDDGCQTAYEYWLLAKRENLEGGRAALYAQASVDHEIARHIAKVRLTREICYNDE